MLAGKYRVERVIGQGGMGAVFAAFHVQLERRVAIKFLLPELVTNEEIVARFTREARAAVAIESIHVAHVIDVGETDDGIPFMVMEYLHGSDLSNVLTERGPLPAQEAVGYVLEACEAIAEAHRLGIVHRDLKPANLYLAQLSDGTNCVKVLDFGISKVETPANVALTSNVSVMGSPQYMAPEQMKSTRDVDTRADIWALGVILYELLTGKVPFPGEGFHQVLARVLTEPPERLEAHVPDLPPKLCAAVMRCLEKDPAARYRSVAELAIAIAKHGPTGDAERSLDRILRVHQSNSFRMTQPGEVPSLPPASTAETNVGVSANTAEGSITLSRRKVGATVAVAGGVAVILAASLGLWWSRSRSEPTVSTAEQQHLLGTGDVLPADLSAAAGASAMPALPASQPPPLVEVVPSADAAASTASTGTSPPAPRNTRTGRDVPATPKTTTTRTAPPAATQTAPPTATQPAPPATTTPPPNKNPLDVTIK